MEDRQPARPGICIHAPWRARNAPAAGQPGHRVAELVIGPLLQLLPTMLHREALVAFPVEPQHAQDLLGRRPSARRLADPAIAQTRRPLIAQPVAPAPERPLRDPPASPPLPPATARPAHAARAVPQNASVVPLAALLPDPSPAPFSSGSKTGQITRYKNRTDISQPQDARFTVAQEAGRGHPAHTTPRSGKCRLYTIWEHSPGVARGNV